MSSKEVNLGQISGVSTREDMTPERAIWALFQLLSLQEAMLIFPDDSIKKHRCVLDFLKGGNTLKKQYISKNFKSLLFATSVLGVNQEEDGTLHMLKSCHSYWMDLEWLAMLILFV